MDTLRSEAVGIAERTAALEMAFIHEYMGEHLPKKRTVPLDQFEKIWREALLYAALRLEEVKAKAHLVDVLHERLTCM